MTALDDRDREWIERELDKAPAPTQEQVDTLARIFDGIPAPEPRRYGQGRSA